jgi:hypothetical protein
MHGRKESQLQTRRQCIVGGRLALCITAISDLLGPTVVPSKGGVPHLPLDSTAFILRTKPPMHDPCGGRGYITAKP